MGERDWQMPIPCAYAVFLPNQDQVDNKTSWITGWTIGRCPIFGRTDLGDCLALLQSIDNAPASRTL